MSPNSNQRENSSELHSLCKSPRRSGGASSFLRSAWRLGRLISGGVILQTSGCMFDGEAFISDSLAAIYENVATTLIITTLSDLLGVTPSFAF